MKNLESTIINLCNENKKIDAILLLQRENGLSLNEATNAVERTLKGSNIKQTPAIKNSDYTNIKPIFITLVFVGIIILGFCLKSYISNKDPRPKSQIEFENQLVSLIQDASLDNTNEVKRDAAAKELAALIDNKIDIIDWTGEVIGVEKTVLNGNGIRIQSDPGEHKQGTVINYFLKGIDDKQLFELMQGNKVHFSGVVSGSDVLSLQGAISSIFNQDIVQVQSASVTVVGK